ncbi:MAG: DUF445 family protein, partial [Planctomycetes bacterium]|nr:DUF445 family protein [Planctomycetota bacterium]
MPRNFKRHYGSISLALASGGFIATELARGQGWIGGSGGVLVSAAFEAATIGGVADWFAVRALFHRVPIPVLGRHTDIIVRQRARITENIVDMVEETWLAPEVIGAQLDRLVNANTVLTWLEDPARRAQGTDIAGHLIGMLARQLKSPEASKLMTHVLVDQLEGLDLARPLGAWMERSLASGAHGPAWNALVRAANDQLDDPDIVPLARILVRDAVAALAPGLVDRFSSGPAADALVSELKRVAQGLDLSQPLGAWLAHAIARRDHDPLSEALVDALRADLGASPDFRRLVEGLVREAVERWKGRGWKERLLGGGAEVFGALRYDRIAEDVLSAIDAALVDARTNSANPIRLKIDTALTGFAQRLAAGDPALAAPVRTLVVQLIERADLGALIARVAAWAKVALTAPPGTGPTLFDEDALAVAAVRGLRILLVDLHRRPDHPVRVRIDADLLDFAKRLAGGDERATAVVARAQAHLLAHAPEVLGASLARAQ